jgi:hypothetical protein
VWSMPLSSKCLFPSGFPTKTIYTFFSTSVHGYEPCETWYSSQLL